MSRRTIATKLHIPRSRPGSLPRRRLLENIGGAQDASLILVSAPAGFGKTTLLADWLRESVPSDVAKAWYSLDPSDNNPNDFWSGVIEALEIGLPKSEPLLGGLEANSLAVSMIVNSLDKTGRDVWLILDDFHLIDNLDVNEQLAILIDRAPRNLHLVMCTRSDPNLPLSRLRARGQLVEIRAADLRFTLDEARSYLDGAGLGLDPADVEMLEDRTEGWIAALQLAALSIRGRSDASSFVARFAGDDRYVLDYLADEVLRGQSADVREFLLQTSVLDRMCGRLCDFVLQKSGGGQALATLERMNMFIVPLDDNRQWFRYHHLFGDVLRSVLMAETPERIPLLHERASQWFEGEGMLEEGVTHALAAGSYQRAAHLIEMMMPEIRRERREAILVGWLAALPDPVVFASPVLTAFAGHVSLMSGDLPTADSHFADAEALLEDSAADVRTQWAQTAELRMLPATIAAYRAAIAQASGDVASMRVHAQRSLELASPQDHFARGAGAGFLGLAAWSAGDIDEARVVFAAAVESLRAAGNVVDALVSTVALADMWVVAGRPSEASRLLAEALAEANAHGDLTSRAAAYLHVAASQLALSAGNTEEARNHLDEAARIGDPGRAGEHAFRWFVAKADLDAATGNDDEALARLEDAARLYRPGLVPNTRPIPALRARIWIRQGNLDEAGRWCDRLTEADSGMPEYLREFDDLTVVRLRIAVVNLGADSAALAESRATLDRLRSDAEASGREASLLEVALLDALVRDLQGDSLHATHVLAEAIERAPEPEAFLSVFRGEGDHAARLLAAAGECSSGGEKTRSVNTMLTKDPASARPGRSRSPAACILSERELGVLRMLDTELTGPQIARELFISHNTMRTHTKRIFIKLDVTSRRAAVVRARELGLL